MNNAQEKYLMRHPMAMEQYMRTGRKPACRKPLATPLWQCLSKLTPQARYGIKGITLCPALGYHCSIQFATAEQLYDYLGADRDIIGNASLPSEHYAIGAFTKKLTIQDLFANAIMPF